MRDGMNIRGHYILVLMIWLIASSSSSHCPDYTPLDSLLIAYIAIVQSGLGLMDAHTHAVPDFVLAMSQAI